MYYLQRSQPPVLSEMVRVVHAATGDSVFLRAALPVLREEYAFWMTTGQYGHAVEVLVPAGVGEVMADGPRDTRAGDHTLEGGTGLGSGTASLRVLLNRYVTDSPRPRPESWREDEDTRVKAGLAADSAAAHSLYRAIAAGAETGWDFSSRWFADDSTLATIDVPDLVPVDLNSIMYRFERNVHAMCGVVGDASCAATFQKAAADRQTAIEALLWSAVSASVLGSPRPLSWSSRAPACVRDTLLAILDAPLLNCL